MPEVDMLLTMSELLRKGFADIDDKFSSRAERFAQFEQMLAANSQAIGRVFKIIDGNEEIGRAHV